MTKSRPGLSGHQAKRIAVIGAGGHARSVANILLDMGHEIVALLDDASSLHGGSYAGYDVLGPPALVQTLDVDAAIVAIGDNTARRQQFEQLERWGIPLVSAIHPLAYIARDASLGRGIVVMPFAVVNTGAIVGDNTIVSMQALVAHECVLASHSHLAAHASLCGRVVVQEGAFVGAGSTVLPGKQIGAWSTVGAGATVISDLPPNVVAAGVPARIRRRL